ncbi:MAG: asparaginase [Oscillospiraceae bacterium]|nr:asparaginase [Oscillospiraceae bacterium]
MKKILLLTTGGTISSRLMGEGLEPDPKLDLLPESLKASYEVTVKSILNLDSSNIQPEEWQLVAEEVFKAKDSYDGIVISHGTDTMAYTSSVLTFMLLGIRIPVVLTGSQLPIDHPLTDGVDNLRTAFSMAASGRGGIFLAFDRKVILGCRAVKTHTTDFGAFDSVNHPLIARVSGRGLEINDDAIPEYDGDCILRKEISKKVFLLKLTPGLDPGIFDMLMDLDYRGIVIEAFGAGGLHFIRRNLVEKLELLRKTGITVVVNSQCLYETSDFTLYQTGQRVLKTGAIESRDMTTEAAVTKLMWSLGRTDDPEKVRELFSRSYFGEIS